MQIQDSSSGWKLGSSQTHPPTPSSPLPSVTPSPAAPRVAGRPDVQRIAQYDIVRQLGKGGMGVVYLGYDPLMHRTVAVKVLHSDPAAQDVYAKSARFLAEAMLTGRLTHAGIIPIYQVGYDPHHGYYYSMRYLQGRTLHQIIRQRARRGWDSEVEFTLSRLLEVFVRVCEAVAHAHRNGVLHRDLKPANIMITDSNEVLVVDWGLAKDLRTHDPLDRMEEAGAPEALATQLRNRHYQTTGAFLSQVRPSGEAPGQTGLFQAVMDGDEDPDEALYNLTQAGLLVGTPWYMSPEQIRGDGEVGPASDVYALGVVLYRLLTNAMPIDSRDLTELISRVSVGDIKRIETRPEALRLPRALCTIVNKALAFDQAERYQNAGQLGDDLRLYLEGRTPLMPLAATAFRDPASRGESLASHWKVSGELRELENGMEAGAGVRMSCRQRALGDLRAVLAFRARTTPWSLAFCVGTQQSGSEDFVAHHEVRLGVEERPYVELLWRGRRVRRRFDLRLQSGQTYLMSVELDDGTLRVRIDGNLALSYREVFPVSGGMIALEVRAGVVLLEDFTWQSRGAPLNLSYQYLPDRFFLSGRYEDALQLYQQMAESHPDREEGLVALYKAGLCCAEMKDTQRAFEMFSKLENTMLDHYCTLGLARIGLLDGNPDWAWEALKSGYLRHKHPEVRNEIWFALLDVLEQYGNEGTGGKLPKYLEMLRELEPTPQETAQITFEYLDLAGRLGGTEALRKEALTLVQAHSTSLQVVGEALYALWRTGLDETVGTLVLGSMNRLKIDKQQDAAAARLLLMRAELELAQGNIEDAVQVLKRAANAAEHSRSERLWALNWLLLCGYLDGDFENTLARGRETLQYMDQYSSDQLAYLLCIVALLLLRLNKPKLAQEALERATKCPGWWSKVVLHVSGRHGAGKLLQVQSNPNLATESLYLAGELHLRLGNGELAVEHFKLCDEHPCRRVMTRQLSRDRLRAIVRQTGQFQAAAQSGGAS